ncbi:MAG TPA: NADPH-dependent F420 reductase [Acidimicrobiia bacterium]|nr:NADPH-dependent F420 reductase [Acidimicrobiia bacterium]
MEIAIIGAGNVGSALATSTVEAGHTVRIASNDRQEAEQVASATGATAAADNASAVQDAEVVILAVPVDALDGLADELGDSLAGKVVVDVTNRLNPEDPAATLDGTSAAEKLQARLPGVPVVKAFNTAFASRQAEPEVAGMRSDGFVAGDDEEAKQKVLGLVESIGFRPVDAGPLGMARALEAMATLNIYLQMRDEGSWQAAWKLVGPE